MKILVLGCGGMTGRELVRSFSRAHEVIPRDIDTVDLRDPSSIGRSIRTARPAWVLNAAAYTDVDGCESNPQLAFEVNAGGVRSLAEICAEEGVRLLHISTDYIFDGESEGGYREDDPPGPLSIYGESKLRGEQFLREVTREHIIVRTQWLFGPGGKSFPERIIAIARDRARNAAPLEVVCDQEGVPTYARDLAEAILVAVEANLRGTFHIVNDGRATWYDLAVVSVELASVRGVQIHPVPTARIPRPARRPRSSVLLSDRFRDATGHHPRHWRGALSDFVGSLAGPPPP